MYIKIKKKLKRHFDVFLGVHGKQPEAMAGEKQRFNKERVRQAAAKSQEKAFGSHPQAAKWERRSFSH